MRRVHAWMGLSAFAAFELISPRIAAACSCVADPFYHANPADGARDVALNRALFIEGVFHPKSIRLEDERGNPVEFELNAGPWPGCAGTSADVIPKAPLAPNARYTIRVEPLYPTALGPEQASSLTFTTGTAMLPDQDLEPPRGTATMLFDGPRAICGVATTQYTCLGIEDPKGVELILRRGEEVLLRTTTLVQNHGLYGATAQPDCVELRRRAPTGKRSEPLKICGDALKPRAWAPSDSVQQVIQCRNGVIGQPSASGTAGAESEPRPDSGSAGRLSTAEAGSRALEAGARAHAGARAEAGARDETDGPPPSASDAADHRSYGCAAMSGDPSGAGLLVWLALALCARRRSRA